MAEMMDLSTGNRSVWLEVHAGLGISLMDHLYNRMEGMYPQRWKANFPSATSIQNWRESWAEAFEDERITPQDIAAGLKACRKRHDWPPSLPEFIRACKPPVDYETLFAGSAVSVSTGKWENRLAYWATQSVGSFEVRNEPYVRMKTRWTKAIDELLEDGELPEIPPGREALPAPGKQSISKEEAAMRVNELGLDPKRKEPKAWARMILESPAVYPAISIAFAKQALGVSA
jgi:hypothetical protein